MANIQIFSDFNTVSEQAWKALYTEPDPDENQFSQIHFHTYTHKLYRLVQDWDALHINSLISFLSKNADCSECSAPPQKFVCWKLKTGCREGGMQNLSVGLAAHTWNCGAVWVKSKLGSCVVDWHEAIIPLAAPLRTINNGLIQSNTMDYMTLNFPLLDIVARLQSDVWSLCYCTAVEFTELLIKE